VNADDLCRLHRRKVDGVIDTDLAAVTGDQHASVPRHRDRVPVKQDPAMLRHEA
jgi:hypothetical protein